MSLLVKSSKAGAGKPSAPLRHGAHTSATSPTAMSDLRGHFDGAQGRSAGIERAFERRDFRFELLLQIVELLLQDLQAFIGAVDIAAFAADACCRARRRSRRD